jgi:hypothetical protein
MRLLFAILCLIFIAPVAWAQTTATEQAPPDEQNETMRDTFKRMQIKREEEEHKKIVDKGAQIKEDVEALAKNASDGHLPRAQAEKRLKEIEKSARQIRSDSGGGQDDPLESPPDNLADALKRLDEVSAKLNDNLAKTSRRVVSVAVVEDTTEIIQLVKILRNYLN